MTSELKLIMAIWFFVVCAMGFAYFVLIFGRGDEE